MAMPSVPCRLATSCLQRRPRVLRTSPPPRATVVAPTRTSLHSHFTPCAGGSALKLHLLDADAVALHAARANVSGARFWLSDCWAELPPKKRFDWIVSNPPVHNGLQTDFRVLRSLVTAASRRLRKGGSVWIVCQEYVPVGRLLAAELPVLTAARAVFDDGRFTVWTAQRARSGGGATAANAAAVEGTPLERKERGATASNARVAPGPPSPLQPGTAPGCVAQDSRRAAPPCLYTGATQEHDWSAIRSRTGSR